MDVENFADFFFKTVYDVQTVAVESADERFQHILMESGSNQFAMWTPMFATADQKTVAQPWFEESVFIWFVDMHMTSENDFDIFWMCQKYDQFWSDPNSR